MEELYACVRFTDELKKNQFVSVKEIKVDKSDTHHIRPATVDDFDPQRQYDILWCLCDTIDCTDINNKSCEYHKGYIVCLAETLADAEEKGNSTRFRLPRKIFSPSDPKLPSNSETILQKNCSQSTVSGLHNFNQKLVVKLDNLNHAKAIEKAKLSASKEQLGAYAKNQFTGGRKSFLSFSQNDHDNGKRRSNEGEHNVNGPLLNKKSRTAREKDPLSLDEDSEPEIPDDYEDSYSEKETRSRPTTPIDNLSDTHEGTNDQTLHDGIERDNLRPGEIGGHRVRGIRKPPRQARPRQLEPAEISADERAINLYITPEAVDVDPRDRQKYQTFENNMIYLGGGKAVDKEFWEFLKLRGDSLFLRETAELICGKHDLVNRCIKEKKTSVTIQGRSPRKAIPPSKYFLIRELFQDYMKEREYDKSTRDRLLSTFNRQLGYKIQDLRKALFN